MKTFFLRLALITTVLVPATSALAADLDPPPPLLPTTSDWTGGYVGVVGSVTSVDGHYDKIPDCDPLDPNPCGPVDPEMSGTGFMGGVLAGWNYDMDGFLLGIEADYTWGGMIAQNRDPAELTELEFNSMGTLRARAGVVMDDTLLYVTGGVAMIETTFKGEVGPVAAPYSADDSAWLTGWAIGGGIEQAFTESLHGRLEYIYVGAPDQSYRLEDPNGFGGDIDMQFEGIHTIRAGLTYNFSL